MFLSPPGGCEGGKEKMKFLKERRRESMCLFPKLIKNKKYLPTKKNNFNPPTCNDKRLLYVPVGCGRCIECRKQKSREWQTRLQEEIKTNKCGKFVTLTFAPEQLEKLCEETGGLPECNALAGTAVRRFLERWRKSEKKSVKHWLITEMGHENTKRIHLHGIIFTEKPKEFIEKKWQYGQIWIGEYVNEKTINYIIKYVTKTDNENKGFVGQIFCSPGIGKNYTKTFNATQNKYIPNQTKEYYRLKNGNKTALPIYYRNKLYTEEEREKLWLEKLDKEERYVLGQKISVKENDVRYWEAVKLAREYNKKLGYGDNSETWNEKQYNITLNMLRKETKIQQYKNNPDAWRDKMIKEIKKREKKKQSKK